MSAKGICSLTTINNPKTENPFTDISLLSTAARLGINCCCYCCACCCCSPDTANVVVVVFLLLHPWATPAKTAATRASVGVEFRFLALLSVQLLQVEVIIHYYSGSTVNSSICFWTVLWNCLLQMKRNFILGTSYRTRY